MFEIYFTSNDDISVCNSQISELDCSSSTYTVKNDTLKLMFDSDDIHTACVKGPMPTIRGWKDCKILPTPYDNVFLICKD